MNLANIETEIATLAHEFGAPLRRHVRLQYEWPFDPLGKPDRYGEICMVIQRPNGRLITAKKTFYPAGTFRLLTGGIHHGEPILEALLRETMEETGLEVRVRRFLAAIGYQRPGAEETAPPLFWTFAFLLDEQGGDLACADPSERLEAFREIAIGELPTVAAHLEALTTERDVEINGHWRDWGRFRAIVHRVTFEILGGSDR